MATVSSDTFKAGVSEKPSSYNRFFFLLIFLTAGAAFLSFSRQRPYHDSVDSRTFTGEFCQCLKENGCNPWMDAYDLQSGDSLSIKIYKTLDECKAVVPIVTRGYAQSLWCLRELYYAMSKRSPQIYPVVLESGWEMEMGESGSH